MKIFVLATGLALVATSPALALGCSEGTHFADAQVTPGKTMGTITTATQYAWDGRTGTVRTCNLTSDSGVLAGTWQLFSGEIDVGHGGICIQLTNQQGRSWYSCVSPQMVARAGAARPDTPEFDLLFRDWQDGPEFFAR
ncbi:MAG: hypothetical protein KDK12_00825 [Rhodobacteraceae bacterium]|nr:hypothetical protein [Paracoccaceae bacterium]